jgi:hypothetical protein
MQGSQLSREQENRTHDETGIVRAHGRGGRWEDVCEHLGAEQQVDGQITEEGTIHESEYHSLEELRLSRVAKHGFRKIAIGNPTRVMQEKSPQ